MATPDGRYIAHPPSPGDGRRDPTAGKIRLERCGGGRLRAQPVKTVLASRDESVGSLVLQVKASAFPWPEGEPPAARLGPHLRRKGSARAGRRRGGKDRALLSPALQSASIRMASLRRREYRVEG